MNRENMKNPVSILLELTTRCNNACVFCKHKEMKSPIGDMSLDLGKKILQDAYNMGVRTVGMHTIGEIFLCKNFAKHIANAKQIGFDYIYATSNGILATRENLENAIKAGLDSIKFSIDAGTNKTHALIHYGKDNVGVGDGFGRFDKVLNNLKICFDLKEKLNKKMKIIVGYVLIKQNEQELEILKKLVEPYITEQIMVYPVVVFGAGSSLKEYINPCLEMIPTGYALQKTVPCSMVFDRIHVTHDGYLTACCQDFDRELLIANLNEVSLKEAWISKRAVEIREKHANKNVEDLICNNCFRCV